MLVRTPFELGQFIRELRLAKGWSQTTAAAQARVSQPWLSAVENGKRTAEIGRVMRVMRTLGGVMDVLDAASLPVPEDRPDIDAIADGVAPGGEP